MRFVNPLILSKDFTNCTKNDTIWLSKQLKGGYAYEAREISVDISHILGNLITVIFDYQILRKPLKILSL